MSHDGEEEGFGGVGMVRGMFNMVDPKWEGSGSLRGGVFTDVFEFTNKSGTFKLENEDSVGAGTGESIGSSEEGTGTVTGSDDADWGCGDDGDDLLLDDSGLIVMCSRLAWRTTW